MAARRLAAPTATAWSSNSRRNSRLTQRATSRAPAARRRLRPARTSARATSTSTASTPMTSAASWPTSSGISGSVRGSSPSHTTRTTMRPTGTSTAARTSRSRTSLGRRCSRSRPLVRHTTSFASRSTKAAKARLAPWRAVGNPLPQTRIDRGGQSYGGAAGPPKARWTPVATRHRLWYIGG